MTTIYVVSAFVTGIIVGGLVTSGVYDIRKNVLKNTKDEE